MRKEDFLKKMEKEGVIIGKTEFNSAEEAQIVVDSMNMADTRVGVFCPLIRDICRTNCASFQRARVGINPNIPDKFLIVGFGCESPMIRPQKA